MSTILENISEIPSFLYLITGISGLIFYTSLSKQQKKYDKWFSVLNDFKVKEENLNSYITLTNNKVKKDLTIAWVTLFTLILLLFVFMSLTKMIYLVTFTVILAINVVIYTKYFNKVAYHNLLFTVPKNINEENIYMSIISVMKWKEFKNSLTEDVLKSIRNVDYKFIMISSNLIDYSRKTDPNYEKAVGNLIVQCAENVLTVRKYLDTSFMLGVEKSLNIHKIFLNYEKEIIEFEHKTALFKNESENVYQEVQNILEVMNNCKLEIENSLNEYGINNVDVINFIEVKKR